MVLGQFPAWLLFPVIGALTVFVQSHFMPAIQLSSGVKTGTGLNDLAIEFDGHRGVCPTDGLNPVRRNQNAMTAPPIGGVNDQIRTMCAE